ncbi:hypothetical protein [Allocoleopsis franciscana]|uniref:Secreted protein n=1 Tax=Allocoleopsis franciscana PCC 7113 TaxID=1173027 RepID=K9WH08_9CYAN|nr:hypothetical protein [Allocoleopsis franciscana]AFZ18817.1 hypothetical protein Mic7113_3058 [Allocoleopsis franciscana PCC 7113]
MKKLLVALTSKPTALISVASLLMTGKISTANQPVNPQPVNRTDATITPVSAESQKACVKHPKLGKFFCANAQQLSQLKKGAPEIDATDVNNEDALLGVTDEESDAAVSMFGCDCVASINCLRRLRNSLP